MPITIDMRTEGVRQVLQFIPDQLAHHVREEFKKLGIDFQRAVASNFASRHPGAGRRAKYWVLDQKTKRLQQYRRGPGDPGMKDGEAELGVFSSSPLLLAHELGLKITDPSGGAMAIPMGGAATKKLRRAKEVFRRGGQFAPSLVAPTRLFSKRNQADEFRIIRLRGKLYAAQIDEQGEIKDLYARIVKSVKLKPSLGFYTTWNRMKAERDAAIDRAVGKAVKSIKGIRPELLARPEFTSSMKAAVAARRRSFR